MPVALPRMKWRPLCALAGLLATTAAATPVDDWLRQRQPALARLEQDYAAYIAPMTHYAAGQGFRTPVAQRATVLHELIHIASASQHGFFIDGQYVLPYLQPGAWPALRNRDIRPLMQVGEQGIIYRSYMPGTPDNGMANVLDEINAYSQVLAMVCALEPASASAQAERLLGHLQLLEAYLRVARSQYAEQYQALLRQRASIGALARIGARARRELMACGLPDTDLPGAELARLVSAAGVAGNAHDAAR